ncbi:hypothetical protein CK203_111080 [Vitis vinifera]|uniref:Transposon Ty3-I Gag-Pol polyprotein n=1 Tax=Vitis vinifera TaxID=29760 RepID=A0A438DPS9_VITVI|nr:hypothetical protein CK203_111080 [Vitis vinifera]
MGLRTSFLWITPTSPDRASMLSLCFPEEITDDGVIVDPTEMIDGVVPMMRDQIIPVPELLEDDSSLFEGTVSPVEGASDLVDPPLSFDVLSGFVSRSDDIFDIDDELHGPIDRDSSDHDSIPWMKSFTCYRDVETVDFGTEDQPRELKIGSPLSTDERDRLIHLLRSYLDVFAWSYEDMPGLDPSIVKEEIQKQLSVGFISVVEYPECPKDDFPLPHIDLLVDSTAGHSMLSFMDGFSGYNQILMAPEDMEKTTFITEWGIEVYVDDMIVKSQGRADHLEALERFFERIRMSGIEVDPDKIKAILDMPAPKTEKEIRGFLGRLQYISRFIARLTDILPPTPGRPLLLYLSVSDMALGSPMLSTSLGYQEIEALHDRKSIKGSIVADHLASLPTSEDRPVDDDFPDEEFAAMTSLSGWCMYFDGAANSVRVWDRARTRFADILATLVSSVDIPIDVVIRPLLIELRSAPAYYCLIGETEVQDDLPWYHDIYQFLRFGTYPEVATAKDRRALRNLATRFVICGDTLYKRSADGMLLLCLDRASVDRVMREIVVSLFRNAQSVRFHGDLIHAPPLELHALTSPWPFSVWGIDIIGKVSPKSSSGHEFILVAIDYFTKWVEAASYVRLTSARVASFIRSMPFDIIDLQHIGHRPTGQ